MVFSSLPIYLDPPNWNQQAPSNPPQVPSLLPDSPQQPVSAGQARPVSMAERARLAKIPQPEQALKCPRCDSTNTKFCYFNNYSLSQPRHFCKTCRRYWTRGGALRNVPVGGGCRRNKRSKASSSASKQAGSSAPASMGPAATLPPPPFIPFPFHHLSDFAATNIALGFNPMDSVDYQIGSGGGLEQWRIQQIQQLPFAGTIDASSAVTGLFPFDGESEGFSGCRPLSKSSSAGLISQLASVKMEDSSQGIQLQRAAQYLGAGNDQYWSGNGDAAGNGCGWLGDLSGNIL